MGIEALKKILAFPLGIHMAFDKANQDGSIDAKDVGYLIDVAMKIGPFIGAIGDALPELKDLSSEEQEQLSEWMKTEYDILDDELEDKLEAAFDVVIAIVALVGKL